MKLNNDHLKQYPPQKESPALFVSTILEASINVTSTVITSSFLASKVAFFPYVHTTTLSLYPTLSRPAIYFITVGKSPSKFKFLANCATSSSLPKRKSTYGKTAKISLNLSETALTLDKVKHVLTPFSEAIL